MRRLNMVAIVAAMAALTWACEGPVGADGDPGAAGVQGGFWLVLYAVLLPMVELHVGIGFYRIGVKWGFIQRGGRRMLGGFEKALTVFFLAVGVLTLIRFFTLTIS